MSTQEPYLITNAAAAFSVLPEASELNLVEKQKAESPATTLAESVLEESPGKQAKLAGIYRSTMFQFLIVGTLAFAGPAMADAIGNLGGGGLATPYTANAANAGSYAFNAVTALCAPVLIGKIGLKWTLLLGAATFPLLGSSMYVNSEYGVQWYMIFAYCIAGVGTALWYVCEASIVLSYPEPGRRGRYLAWWIVSRNLGQLVGGAINLSVNVNRSGGGGVSPKTYLIFVAIECLGFPAGFLFSNPRNVRRKDGTRVIMAPRLTFKEEFKALCKQYLSKRNLMLLVYFFVSCFIVERKGQTDLFHITVFFFLYTPRSGFIVAAAPYGTLPSLHFSTRARALSSLIAPAFCIVGCFALGMLLDMKRLSQRTRAKMGFAFVILPNLLVYIWTFTIMGVWSGDPMESVKKYDWTDKSWAAFYLPYFLVQTTGPTSQSFMFWLLSCFAVDVQSNTRAGGIFRSMEAVGIAVSYAINSNANTLWAAMGVNAALLFLTIPTAWLVIRTVPDISPMEFRAQAERGAAAEKQVSSEA